ncbi:hypothetical protein ABEB36_008514 [Hypothenemus hampei]|uniref:Uncharacterized protein n=1 Tax=Hypothenemus hampei TaxID=57062 RepID=A0ABD1EM55_HYPHA
MAHCLISVCIFCFICATHWPCSAHSTADHLKHYHHGDLGYHNIQLSEGTLLRVKRNESHHTSNKTNHKTGNTIKKNANAKFLEQLLIKYGDGEKINVAGLEELLQKLEFMRVTSERTNSHQIEDFLAIDLRKDSEYSQRNGSCFSKEATTILQQTTEEKYLTRTAFSEACPILLYSLLDDSCLDLERNTFNISSSDKHDIDAKIWLYSSLAVVLISICGVGALVVIPLMQKRFYKPMIQFLVALAVGTLSGDALLHLFPHAMSSSHTHGHHGDEDLHLQNTWMGFVAMMGLTFFFVMERLILLAAKWRKKKQKQNNVPHVHVKIYNDQGQRRNSTQCMDKYNNSPYCYKDIMAESSNKTDIKLKNSRSSTIENSETNQNACEGELIPNPCNEEKMLRRDHEDYTVIVREHVNDHHGHSHKHGHVHSAPQVRL